MEFWPFHPHACVRVGYYINHHLALEAFGGFGPTPLEAFGVEVQALSTGALELYKLDLKSLIGLLAIHSFRP